MKLSEAFEGDNSSLKKTFEEVVYEATPFSPGVLTVGGPAQKEEWDMQFRELPAVNYNLYLGAGTNENCLLIEDAEKQIIDFIRSQIALAEARGREEHHFQSCDTCYGERQQGIEQSRLSTITAFEEFAKDNESNNKGCGEDGYVTLTDLLSFADSLKSNAPKV